MNKGEGGMIRREDPFFLRSTTAIEREREATISELSCSCIQSRALITVPLKTIVTQGSNFTLLKAIKILYFSCRIWAFNSSYYIRETILYRLLSIWNPNLSVDCESRGRTDIQAFDKGNN